jgi:hypothetical protein
MRYLKVYMTGSFGPSRTGVFARADGNVEENV